MTNPQTPFPSDGPEGYRAPETSQLPPVDGPAQPMQTPSPKRGNALTSKPVIAVAALVVGLALGAGAGGAGGSAATVAAVPAPTVTVTTTATYEAEPTAEPSVEPTAEPTETAAEPTAAPAPKKKSYKSLSSRQYKLLVKDPDSYIGKTYVIYGEITQFDAATGTDTFRADTGPKKLRISYGYVNYGQNSFLNGKESKLKKLVEGDCFKAKVTVLGSFSYDTQAGGNTTVPLFQVDSISVYGSTD